jgi:hypothetical protein
MFGGILRELAAGHYMQYHMIPQCDALLTEGGVAEC